MRTTILAIVTVAAMARKPSALQKITNVVNRIDKMIDGAEPVIKTLKAENKKQRNLKRKYRRLHRMFTRMNKRYLRLKRRQARKAAKIAKRIAKRAARKAAKRAARKAAKRADAKKGQPKVDGFCPKGEHMMNHQYDNKNGSPNCECVSEGNECEKNMGPKGASCIFDKRCTTGPKADSRAKAVAINKKWCKTHPKKCAHFDKVVRWCSTHMVCGQKVGAAFKKYKGTGDVGHWCRKRKDCRDQIEAAYKKCSTNKTAQCAHDAMRAAKPAAKKVVAAKPWRSHYCKNRMMYAAKMKNMQSRKIQCKEEAWPGTQPHAQNQIKRCEEGDYIKYALQEVKRACPNDQNPNIATITKEMMPAVKKWMANFHKNLAKKVKGATEFYASRAGKKMNEKEIKNCERRVEQQNKGKPASQIWRTAAWCPLERKVQIARETRNVALFNQANGKIQEMQKQLNERRMNTPGTKRECEEMTGTYAMTTSSRTKAACSAGKIKSINKGDCDKTLKKYEDHFIKMLAAKKCGVPKVDDALHEKYAAFITKKLAEVTK